MGNRRWSDGFLCIVVFFIVGADVLLLLVWSVIDVFTVRDVETLQATASPPYYEVVQLCYSEYLQIWTAVAIAEVGSGGRGTSGITEELWLRLALVASAL